MADNNCNDCLDLEPDFCQGEKIYTKCVVSDVGIPYLDILANETLNVTLQKIINAIEVLSDRITALEEA